MANFDRLRILTPTEHRHHRQLIAWLEHVVLQDCREFAGWISGPARAGAFRETAVRSGERCAAARGVTGRLGVGPGTAASGRPATGAPSALAARQSLATRELWASSLSGPVYSVLPYRRVCEFGRRASRLSGGSPAGGHSGVSPAGALTLAGSESVSPSAAKLPSGSRASLRPTIPSVCPLERRFCSAPNDGTGCCS